MSQIPMTLVGKQKLEAELKRLRSVDRPKVIAAIAEARAHGDLSENAEYDAAKDKQGFVEGRIKEIEDKLARAHVVDPKEIRSSRIVFGATIKLLDVNTEEKRAFKIVGTDEADAKNGLVSIESPIARSLLNRGVGDTVLVRVPKGEIEYEILEVRYE
jgi:transcription elongation factor GreA